MSHENPTLVGLAAQISDSVDAISNYLKQNNCPQPSFAADGPERYPGAPEVQIARATLLSSLRDLYHLAAGPADFLFEQGLMLHHDQGVIDVCNQFNIWGAVPLTGSTTYAAIASATSLPESYVRRILRHAMTLHIFAETAPGSGEVIHTATSALAARNAGVRAWIGHGVDECGAASVKLAEALKRFAGSGHPGESAAQIALYPTYRKDQSMFDFYLEDGKDEEKGWRMRRFGQAMEYVSDTLGVKDVHVHQGFDWDGLGRATVVDIGGSVGHISFGLASQHPNLTCIVQDLAGLEPQFNTLRPSELTSRVSFQPHDFFKTQPVKNADVYFLKHILHDWSDPYATMILKALVPALQPGNRVLIMEAVVPPRGVAPPNTERILTAADLQMMILLDSKERSLEDWEGLFKSVDQRFVLRGVKNPEGSPFAIVEFVFEG